MSGHLWLGIWFICGNNILLNGFSRNYNIIYIIIGYIQNVDGEKQFLILTV